MAFMTVREVAEHLGASQSFVYALLGSGRLRYLQLGNGQGCKRVSMEHLQEYLASVERGGEAQAKKVHRKPVKLKHLTVGAK